MNVWNKMKLVTYLPSSGTLKISSIKDRIFYGSFASYTAIEMDVSVVLTVSHAIIIAVLCKKKYFSKYLYIYSTYEMYTKTEEL